MTKAVFTTKVNPTYDDLPEDRYHFPSTYLRAVEAALGDLIVYYEPRRASGEPNSRGGRQVYFAIARVRDIQPDPAHADHYYAFVEGYLEFVRPVPFREGQHYYESALRRPDGETSKGAFGRAVRPLGDGEYDDIFQSGFATLLGSDAIATTLNSGTASGVAEEQEEYDRPIVQRLVSRPFRDAAFSASIRTAYDGTCAMTGLKLVNGGGRTEAQAAHIRPVSDLGPDSVRNGLSLSSTMHWMFDRGLVSVSDSYEILVAQRGVPDAIGRLLVEDRKLRLPHRAELQPHPMFLRYHRERVYKGP